MDLVHNLYLYFGHCLLMAKNIFYDADIAWEKY
jgi:hypothetical protein